MVNPRIFLCWPAVILGCWFALALGGCEAAEPTEDELVETYFLPNNERETVKASFRLCDSVNTVAMKWINDIYLADNSTTVVRLFDQFEKDLKIPESSSSWVEFQTVQKEVKKQAAKTSIKEMHRLRTDAGYLLAGFLHRYYLRNAGNLGRRLGYFDKKIYQPIKAGAIPDCVAQGKGPIARDEDMMSWILLGLGALAAMMVLYWLSWLLRKSPSRPAATAPSPKTESPRPAAVEKTAPPAFVPPALEKKSPPPPPPMEKTAVPPPSSVGTTDWAQVLANTEKPVTPPPLPPPRPVPPPIKTPPPIEDITPPTPVTPPPEPAPAPPPVKPKLLYARLPSGRIFHAFGEAFVPGETFFVLSIPPDDPRSAAVSLTEHPETREFLFTRMRGYQEICDLLGPGMPVAVKVREVAPGSAKFNGEYWVMDKNIQLDW